MELGHSGTDGVDGDPRGNQFHGGWVFPALLAVVLLVTLVIVVSSGPAENRDSSSPTAHATPSAMPQGDAVALEIDFGNGATRQFAALPWRPEMTVSEVMEEARKFHPGISFTQVGTGASGLLTAIDGVKNKGSGGKNWRYRVDDRFAEVSFCLEPVEPGVSVLWEFAAGD